MDETSVGEGLSAWEGRDVEKRATAGRIVLARVYNREEGVRIRAIEMMDDGIGEGEMGFVTIRRRGDDRLAAFREEWVRRAEPDWPAALMAERNILCEERRGDAAAMPIGGWMV